MRYICPSETIEEAISKVDKLVCIDEPVKILREKKTGNFIIFGEKTEGQYSILSPKFEITLDIDTNNIQGAMIFIAQKFGHQQLILKGNEIYDEENIYRGKFE